MGRIGLYYNMNTCMGCKLCQTACKETHGLGLGEYNRRVDILSVGEGDEKVYFPISASCNQCEDPACVKACPTGAMHTTEEGVVLHDDSICIACGACLWNCPYGSVSFSRKKGVTQKCQGCYDTLRSGKNPACVDACPTASLKVGDLDELRREYGEVTVKPMIGTGRVSTDPVTMIRPSKALAAAMKKGDK